MNRELIPTGIDSLDRVLGGGIPRRQAIIVTGDPGTGKTILCSQIASLRARAGDAVVMATVTSEPHDKLVEELRGFSFFDPERVGQEIFLVSAYPWLRKGPTQAIELLLDLVRTKRARVLFIDGLRSIRDLWQDEAKLRDFLYELNTGLAQLDCIGLFTTEYPLEELVGLPEAATVDGIIALSQRRRGEQVIRRVQVAKLRGRPHLLGEHALHVTTAGIHVVPRLESTVAEDVDFSPSEARASFGVRELDRMLDGGLPERSTTLVAGSTGVGKTLMALHFAAEGARRGEGAVFVSYSEPPERLIARARRIGLDVAPLVASGRLRLRYRLATEVEADDLAAEILDAVRESGARRLVVDGIGELERAVTQPERRRAFLTALIVCLRRQQVTSLFLCEVSKLAGSDVDLSETPIAVTAENMMLLRYVEQSGRLHRVVSIVKMRESCCDPAVREFVIGRDGLKVLSPVTSANGLLAEQARHAEGG